MVTHRQARKYAANALVEVFGEAPAPEHALRHLRGIGKLETGYGQWLGGNNVGGIQAGAHWTGETFEHTDTHPNPDGTSTTYTTLFRAYPTLEAGWEDLVRVGFGGSRRGVRIAANFGDTFTVSERLFHTHYYEGFGRDAEERIQNHFKRLRACIWGADRSEGVETPEALAVVPPTVRMGDRNDFVRQLQLELQGFRQIGVDGWFGDETDAAVRGYQGAHWLDVDGIVGPATWTVLLTDDYEPAVAA